MIDNRDSFIFYRSYFEAIDNMPLEEQIILYRAIVCYALNNEKPTLLGANKSIFTLVKPNLDYSIKQYENGCKGGRPKTQKKPKENPKKTDMQNIDNPPNIDMDNDCNTNINSYSIFDILDISKVICPILYNRHTSKASADYNLGVILAELQQQFTLEQIKELLVKANKTYIVQPKYVALDLVWCLNNSQKIMNAENIDEQSSPQSPQPQKNNRLPEQQYSPEELELLGR